MKSGDGWECNGITGGRWILDEVGAVHDREFRQEYEAIYVADKPYIAPPAYQLHKLKVNADNEFNEAIAKLREEISQIFHVSFQQIGMIKNVEFEVLHALDNAFNADRKLTTTSQNTAKPSATSAIWGKQGQYETSPLPPDEAGEIEEEAVGHIAAYWLDQGKDCHSKRYGIHKTNLDTYHVFSFGSRIEVCTDLSKLRTYMHNDLRHYLEELMDAGIMDEGEPYDYVDMDRDIWEEGL